MAAAVRVLAPVSGRVLDLADVPDPVFAEGIVGPGIALEPVPEVVDVVAPIAGTLLKVFPHAFVVVSPDGLGVLVHLGIDTVELGGAGFTLRAQQGAAIAAGRPVVTFDVPLVASTGRSTLVPVVLLDRPAHVVSPPDGVTPGSRVAAGEPLLDVTNEAEPGHAVGHSAPR